MWNIEYQMIKENEGKVTFIRAAELQARNVFAHLLSAMKFVFPSI